MQKLILTLTVLLSAQFAFAGSADRYLDCKSASGRTTLEGYVPGDSLTLDLTYTIDNKKLEYKDTYEAFNEVKNADVTVLGSLTDAKPSFHFVVTSLIDGLAITFIAIPSTIKVKNTPNGEAGTFKALVVGTDPRSPYQAVSPTIELSCSYNYEI